MDALVCFTIFLICSYCSSCLVQFYRCMWPHRSRPRPTGVSVGMRAEDRSGRSVGRAGRAGERVGRAGGSLQLVGPSTSLGQPSWRKYRPGPSPAGQTLKTYWHKNIKFVNILVENVLPHPPPWGGWWGKSKIVWKHTLFFQITMNKNGASLSQL
jgi:hypothetical protein